MKLIATVNRIIDKKDSPVKAFVSVSIDGAFAVHGIKVCESEKGKFISMPSTAYTDKDGNKQYSDIFHPISKGAREAMYNVIMNAYEFKLMEKMSTEIEVEKTPEEEMTEEPEEEPHMGM